MFDDVQRGWLDGDDYRRAAEAAGVVELPDVPDEPDVARAVAPTPQHRSLAYQDLLDREDARLFAGRWEDNNPPGTPA